MFFLRIVHAFLLLAFAGVVFAIVIDDSGFLFAYLSFLEKFAVIIGLAFLLALNLCILYFLIRNRDVYQRNRRATLLIRKYKKGTLTKQEELILEQFLRDGVLGYNAFGTLRLSDRALRELFE